MSHPEGSDSPEPLGVHPDDQVVICAGTVHYDGSGVLITALTDEQTRQVTGLLEEARRHPFANYHPYKGIPARTLWFRDGGRIEYGGSMGEDIGEAVQPQWSQRVVDFLEQVERDWNRNARKVIDDALQVDAERIKPCGDCVHCLVDSPGFFSITIHCALGYVVFAPLNGGRDYITRDDVRLFTDPGEEGQRLIAGQRFIYGDVFRAYWQLRTQAMATDCLPCSHRGCEAELCRHLDHPGFITPTYSERARCLRDTRRGKCPKCGERLANDRARQCLRCSFQWHHCPQCAQTWERGELNCRHCGFDLYAQAGASPACEQSDLPQQTERKERPR